MRTPEWEGISRSDHHLSVNLFDIYPQIICGVKQATPKCIYADTPIRPAGRSAGSLAKSGTFKGLQTHFANPPTAVCFDCLQIKLVQISVVAHRFDPAPGIVIEVF
jgi:hypothetical protein